MYLFNVPRNLQGKMNWEYDYTRNIICLEKNILQTIINGWRELVSMGYIHLYCTSPSRMASRGRWTARWTITLKKAGGKYFLSLHSMRSIRPSNFSKFLFLRVLECKSWKKLPNLNNTVQMSLSAKPHIPIGRIRCNSTW